MSTEKKIKVTHYYDRFYPLWGGAETHIMSIIENMPDLQFEVITNQLPNTSKFEKHQDNCMIKRFGPIEKSPIYLNKSKLIKKIESLPLLIGEIIRVHRKIEYAKISNSDLVHIHAPFLSMPLLSFDRKYIGNSLLTKILDFSKINKPCVLTIHACHLKNEEEPIDYETDPLYDDYFKRLLKPASDIIVVENFLFEYLQNYLQKNNMIKNLHLIHNSVDSLLFDYNENKIEDRLKVLYVGRFEKNINELIEFLDLLPSFIEFEIVGAGNLNDVIKIKKHMEGKNVKLYPNVSTNKLIQLYQKSNIVWNPVNFESISRVTLEAMSCGRPVIMTNKGDRTPVIHNNTGFLVRKNINSTIDLLKQIYKDEDILKECSENSRNIILTNYSNRVIIPKIKNIYLDLINYN